MVAYNRMSILAETLQAQTRLRFEAALPSDKKGQIIRVKPHTASEARRARRALVREMGRRQALKHVKAVRRAVAS